MASIAHGCRIDLDELQAHVHLLHYVLLLLRLLCILMPVHTVWYSPKGPVVCASGKDAVLIAGGTVDDGALVLQHVVQEFPCRKPKLLHIVRAGGSKRILSGMHRQPTHLSTQVNRSRDCLPQSAGGQQAGLL